MHEAKEGRKDVTTGHVNHGVYVGRRRVLYWADNEIKLKGEALELKDDIHARINEKRQPERGGE